MKNITNEEKIFSNNVIVDSEGRLYIGGFGGFTLITGKLKEIMIKFFKLEVYMKYL